MLTPSLSRNNFQSCVRNGLLHAMQCSELEPSMQAGSIGLQIQCLSKPEDKITVQCPVSVTDAVFGVLENKRDYSDSLLSSLRSLCLWEADKVFRTYNICIISERLQESFWVSYLSLVLRIFLYSASSWSDSLRLKCQLLKIILFLWEELKFPSDGQLGP